MTEAEWQSRVVDVARLYGWKVAHFRPARTARGWRTAMTGDPGWPDLVLARQGQCVFAELKREATKPTPEEKAWLEGLRSAGLDVRLWRPSDWPEVEQTLMNRPPPR